MRWIIPLCLLITPIWCRVNQNNDLQLWVTESLSRPVHPRCSFSLANEWRFGNNISQLYFIYLQGIAGIKVSKQIDLGPGYRQAWRLFDAKWRLTYEPLLDLIFHQRNVFQFRNRISYLAHERAKNVWQYRARIRLSSENWAHNLFIANEVFIDSHFGFTQNRTFAGVNIPLFAMINADLSYMLRFLKSERGWTHQHIFGTWFNFAF